MLVRPEGDLVLWDGTRGSAGFTYLLRPAPGTTVTGFIDLGGDGKDDLLLSLPDGGVVVWDVARGGDGFTALSVPSGYRPVGVGAFTAPGSSDLLLAGPDGALAFMDAGRGSVTPFLTLRPGFSVAGTGEIDARAGDDIIFHNEATGALQLWNGSGFADLPTLASGYGWRVEAVADLVGGAADDLLLFNTHSRILIA